MRYKKTTILFLTVLSLSLLAVSSLQALDTLTVEPGLNTIHAAIQADLNSGFDMNQRVYKLMRGQPYVTNVVIESGGWHLQIVGEAGPVSEKPAYIQPFADETGDAPSPLIQNNGDLTVKNIYFGGFNNLAATEKIAIRSKADSSTIVVDNSIFEYFTYIVIRSDGIWNSFYFTNNIFRNCIAKDRRRSQGRVLDMRGNINKLVKFENNTAFHIAYFIGPVAFQNDVRINHNTMVNLRRTSGAVPSQRTIDFEYTNNLVLNNGYYSDNFGGAYEDTTEGFQEPGVCDVDSLTENPLFVEADRQWTVTNNAIYHEPWLLDVWEELRADPDTTLDSLGVRTHFISEHDSALAVGLGFNIANNTDDIPITFTNMPDVSDKMTVWLREYHLKYALNLEPHFPYQYYSPLFNYDPNLTYDAVGGPVDENGLIMFEWPLQMDFSYPTSSPFYNAGSDGFPLGDLNWFPDKKEKWLTSVESKDINQPLDFTLAQNYPNPFNPTTTINYKLKQVSDVSLAIYNVNGQEVRRLIQAKQKPGNYNVVWDGLDNTAKTVAGGVYFYRLKSSNQVQVKKMVLVK